VRDENTGLYIAAPECHTFGGEEALAYVRSRHYQWFDPTSGKWQTDGTSDAGRVSRQQDFVMRVLLKALARAADSPRTAKEFVDSALRHVVTDSNVTIGQVMAWSTAVGSEAITRARSFQIEATGRTVNNNAVLVPTLDSDYMRGVLDIFRGQEPTNEPVEPRTPVGVTPVEIETAGTSAEQTTQCGTTND
jgi:anionic cell wall polymer biosynthesis LytR-Cps2A-Psr (LCP) family protein